MSIKRIDSESYFDLSSEVRSNDNHTNTGRESREMAVTCVLDNKSMSGMGEKTWISEYSFQDVPNSGSYGVSFGWSDELFVFKHEGEVYMVIESKNGIFEVYKEGHFDPDFEDARKATRAAASERYQRAREEKKKCHCGTEQVGGSIHQSGCPAA